MKQRFPWLTLTVFVVTLAVTAAMYQWPQIGTALERDPAMLRGEWWRFITTWFVLTDGWQQIVINSIGLLFYGIGVERQIGRLWWIVGYIGAGLVGEVAGIFWQPVGGGNSVAICGLIGLFSIWQMGRKGLPTPVQYMGLIIWGAIGLWLFFQADIHGAALLGGFVIGGIAFVLDDRRERKAA
jgi:rhomboid protease GluP